MPACRLQKYSEIFFGATQAHRAFPVTQNNVPIGMLDRAMLSAGGISSNAKVGQLFTEHELIAALPHDSCRDIASRLALHGLERMPVVTSRESRRRVGVVSRSDLIKPSMASFDEEPRREKFRRVRRAAQLESRVDSWR